jgi:hypothetical protein
MSLVRQKEIFDGQHGITHYEITFKAVSHEWISTELYEELNELIDQRILTGQWMHKESSGCKPLDKISPRIEEYADAITDLSFLYDLLRVEGHCTDGKFMKGIKYAHDYLTNKQK